jgi:hypothetical protein
MKNIKKYQVLLPYFARKLDQSMIAFSVGQVVELDEEFAEWVNRDQPGTIEEIKPILPTPDRMVKEPKQRR